MDERKDSGITLLVTKPIATLTIEEDATMSKKIMLPINSEQEFNSSLDEIAREGARRMLCQALDLEV